MITLEGTVLQDILIETDNVVDESAGEDLTYLDGNAGEGAGFDFDESGPFDYTLGLSDEMQTGAEGETIQVVCIRPFFPPEDTLLIEGDAPIFSILPYFDDELENIEFMPPEDEVVEDGWVDDDFAYEDWTSGDWDDEDWVDDGSGDDTVLVDDTGDGDTSGNDSGGEDDGFIWIDWSLEMDTGVWEPEDLPIDEAGPAICIMIVPCVLPIEDTGLLA